MTTKNKMKVEIWSDVMCPYCYMGKRRFEKALSTFKNSEDIEIIWKAFQLAPKIQTDPSKNIHQYLAEHKGISIEEAKHYNDQVTQTAKSLGLTYNFDIAIPANSFNAHRFSHLAKKHGLQNEAEERLFRAYFTEGKNFDDIPTLSQLGKEIGLDVNEVKTVLESDEYVEDVREDIYQAYQMGVSGVPFFLFNEKTSVTGAQESDLFLETLQKTYADWQNENA